MSNGVLLVLAFILVFVVPVVAWKFVRSMFPKTVKCPNCGTEIRVEQVLPRKSAPWNG